MLFALCKKELLAISRDRHALIALFVMPIAFIIIMSLALKNVYNPPLNTLHYAIQTQENTALSEKLITIWKKEHGSAQSLPSNWHAALRDGELDYVLLIDKGFSKAIGDSHMAIKAYVHLIAKSQLDVGAFSANKASLLMTVGALRGEAILQQVQELNPFYLPNKTTTPTININKLVQAKRIYSGIKPSAVQQNVPAWLMFGMFFVVTSMANLFVQESESGTLTRLATLGVSASTMLLAKALPYFLINAAQAALMLVVGVFIVPLLGGDALSLHGINWPALLLMLFVISCAAIGLALCLACVAKTHAQASAIGPMLNVLMAAIGGVMVPTFVMPTSIQHISSYSPMNWGLNGMLSIMLNNQGIIGAMPYMAKLLSFALLMFVCAMLMFKRRIH